MFTAFFQEEKDIGDISVLTELAEELGLDGEDFRKALETGTYRRRTSESPPPTPTKK